MARIKVWSVVVMAAVCLAAGVAWATEANQGAGQDLKDAGHSVASATRKTTTKVKHGVKKGVHKSAAAVDKGAKKVEDKTASSP